jgi:protein-S-isoprenylcysteine O-methyltransferase Ste14
MSGLPAAPGPSFAPCCYQTAENFDPQPPYSPLMRATAFEFRHRFWFIFLLFWAGFSAYGIDHRGTASALVRAFGYGEGSHAIRGVFVFAALLIGLAALVRTWASAYLQSEKVHDANLRTDGVVADGPYRHLRNPLYFGNLLLALGMGLLMSRLGFVIVVLGHVIFLLRLIGREESELLASQGERYRAYYDAVPRLLPSLRPRVPSGGLEPRWPQAFGGELFFWILFAGTAYFAVTLEDRAIPTVALVGTVIYFVMLAVLRRQRARLTSPAAPGSAPR